MALNLLPSLHTLPVQASPTLNMVRSQRLYHCSARDVPEKLGPASMRDVFMLIKGARAFIGEGNQVFVTKKKIAVPRGLKRVPVEELLISFEMEEVRMAICEYLLNEVFPGLAPDEATSWSLDFLIEMDSLLSIPLENAYGDMLTTYNFRTLKNRICTRYLTSVECEKIMEKTRSYTILLKMFQDYEVPAFDDLV